MSIDMCFIMIDLEKKSNFHVFDNSLVDVDPVELIHSPLFKHNSGGAGDDEGEEADR